MRIVPLLPVICLAACSGSGGSRSNTVDVDAAANRAQRDIANYVAGTPTPDDIPATTPRNASSPMPTAPDPAPTTPPANASVEAPPAQRTPEAAASLVKDYVAALAAGRFDEAWKLWRDNGKASGMSAAAFAASFAKYASIQGEIGTPFDQDAGAGQVYISVPLFLHGQLKSGGAYRLRGPVILHRANDGIESKDPTDHLWRIDRTDLKPRPLPNAAPAE